MGNLEDIKSGALEAVFTANGPEGMWAVADTLGRIWTHQKYPTEVPVARWWITADNITEGEHFPAVADYQEQFEELWGVK